MDYAIEFEVALRRDVGTAIRECDYPAEGLIQMVNDRGGVTTARILLASDELQSGLYKLWECGRLDLTVEALIWDNEQFHSLFSEEELRIVRLRLEQLDYIEGGSV